MKQQVITVFGGTGFIGRHVIAALAKSGARIRVATRMPARAYFLRPCGNVGQVVPFACDVHDDASVARALDGATDVVNLIGILFEKGRKQKFDRLHSDFPARLAQLCAQAKISTLVHISALGSTADSTARYARSKAAGEEAIKQHFPRHVILQPSIVFGPEDNFFNQFARMAQRAPFLPLIGGGKTKFQPVYVGDIAQAVARILISGDARPYHGKTYALGGPEVLTFKQLLNLMLEISGLRARYVHLPVPVAKIIGILGSVLPTPPLTVDQVRSLAHDNIVPKNALTLSDLGIAPTALRGVLPSYLGAFRPGGPFANR